MLVWVTLGLSRLALFHCCHCTSLLYACYCSSCDLLNFYYCIICILYVWFCIPYNFSSLFVIQYCIRVSSSYFLFMLFYSYCIFYFLQLFLTLQLYFLYLFLVFFFLAIRFHHGLINLINHSIEWWRPLGELEIISAWWRPPRNPSLPRPLDSWHEGSAP